MEQDKIMTAEEFIRNKFSYSTGINIFSKEDLKLVMIEFAKYHVKLALEKASEEASIIDDKYKNHHEYIIDGDDGIIYTINKDSILNAYPEDLIK